MKIILNTVPSLCGPEKIMSSFAHLFDQSGLNLLNYILEFEKSSFHNVELGEDNDFDPHPYLFMYRLIETRSLSFLGQAMLIENQHKLK